MPQEIVPVQVALPAQASHWNAGTALPKAEPADCEEGIEIRTGNIHIRLPRNTPADYLASLVKELGTYGVDLSDFLPSEIIPEFQERIEKRKNANQGGNRT